MDPVRFDAAMRGLGEVGARVPSRRALLGVLAGSLLATMGGSVPDGVAKHHKKRKNKKHRRGGGGGDDGGGDDGGGECLGELAEMPVTCDDESESLCCSGGCFNDVAGSWCI